MTPEEQRRINQAKAAARAVENGCPDLPSYVLGTVAAFRELMELSWGSDPDVRSLALAVATTDGQDAGPGEDKEVLANALVAVRRASACGSLSRSAQRSLQTTVELLEILAPAPSLQAVPS